MINPDLAANYVATAAKLGVNVTDFMDVRNFMLLLKFMEVKIQRPRGASSDLIVAEELGVPITLVNEHRNGRLWNVCLQVVLAEFMTNESRTDMRNKLFGLYQTFMPQALENMLRVASAQTLNERGVRSDIQPHPRDQVSAFVAISNNELAKAWLNNTFLGDTGPKDEEEHIAIRDGLRTTAKLQLDMPTVVDGEASDVPAQSPSAAPLPDTSDLPPSE